MERKAKWHEKWRPKEIDARATWETQLDPRLFNGALYIPGKGVSSYSADSSLAGCHFCVLSWLEIVPKIHSAQSQNATFEFNSISVGPIISMLFRHVNMTHDHVLSGEKKAITPKELSREWKGERERTRVGTRKACRLVTVAVTKSEVLGFASIFKRFPITSNDYLLRRILPLFWPSLVFFTLPLDFYLLLLDCNCWGQSPLSPRQCVSPDYSFYECFSATRPFPSYDGDCSILECLERFVKLELIDFCKIWFIEVAALSVGALGVLEGSVFGKIRFSSVTFSDLNNERIVWMKSEVDFYSRFWACV